MSEVGMCGLVVGKVPRASFETMEDGLLTSFQLFSLERWNVIALQARMAVGPVGEIFIFVVLAVGNLLLLNVFVAIVALGFGDAAKDAAQKKVRKAAMAAPPPPAQDEQRKGHGKAAEEEEEFGTAGVPLRVCGLLKGGKNEPTLRYYMGVFVTSRLFDRAILGGIVLSTILLAIETYPPVTGPTRQVMNGACYVMGDE